MGHGKTIPKGEYRRHARHVPAVPTGLTEDSLRNLASWRTRTPRRPETGYESLTITRARVLAVLAAAPGLSTRDMELIVGPFKRGHLGNALRSLEAVGLVARVPGSSSNSSRNLRWCLVSQLYLFSDVPAEKRHGTKGGKKARKLVGLDTAMNDADIGEDVMPSPAGEEDCNG